MIGNDDTFGDSVGDDVVGGDVVDIWGSEYSPHSKHTSLASLLVILSISKERHCKT